MTTAAVCARTSAQQAVRLPMCAALVALPFLFPMAAGPSANAWQQLATWICMAFLLLALGVSAARPSPPLAGWLALTGSLVLIRCVPNLSLAAVVATTMAAVMAMACIGAGGTQPNQPLPAVVAWGLLAAGLLSALLGLLQYFGLAETLLPWMNAPEPGQAYGSLRQRNQLATLLSMALVAALWLQPDWTLGWRRVAWTIAVCLLLFGLAASTSRTGLLQLLSIAGVSSWLAWRERRGPGRFRLPPPLLLLASIPVYFFATWLLPLLAGGGVETMGQRLREGAPLAHSRMILWHNVLDLIALRPWTGWGWGELAFAHYSTLYEGIRFTELLDNAHNLPLHLSVELGVPAALLICSGFGWLAIAARPWREADPARLMVWGLLTMILIHSLLEYPLWYGPFQLVFGLCIGFLWPAAASVAPPRLPSKAAPVLGAAVLLIGSVYAAWDYARISQIYLPRDERLPALQDDTLNKVAGSWLFANQVRFAELALSPVDEGHATQVHALAVQLLHFSPEARVVAKLIDSAILLGLRDEASAHIQRFSIAYPREYERWRNDLPIDDPSE
ncbi:Wzy polymerase domain-containing protein [Variovorax sp. KK3]|uniref:PglL family O-oligosaccharyltransferase n=1 Tax=Variovorax sp. KK3 TaxID=1855728 RepID=UPI00097CB66C|nr:Wzy polymerase domain-containing protein [Variovorax sp. KK3]